ncbi:substrate-binding domain-containing protein [Pigmentiphaga sp. GD03639]|uniref:substrate-binding domain-containing protein n=1 Tax=unclassified Pigmentiphaga TaxID=2626614 RepID=UPI00104E9A62|nr:MULTISPECIES: substrate-binding domain-containing protein [unclassified Pigmentiphaga]MDH2236541.1 substrate-binding domain-containing protein [Pigmentiphaga sp. GD03639]
MSMIRKALSGVAVAVSVAIGCASAHAENPDRLRGVIKETKAKRPYRVGVTLVHFVDDYWKGIAYGLTQEAAPAGVQIVRLMGAGGYGKVAEQIAQLESLSTIDLDAVILGATNYDGFDRAIKRLTDKGVKVIAVGVPVNSKLVQAGVTIDEVEVGAMLADYICRQNPKAKVITVPGPNGPAWNKLRFDGVQGRAKKCPGMTLLGNTFRGDTKLEDGLAQASDLLVKYPEADFIYTAAANLGIGAGMAVKRMKSKAKVATGTITDRTVTLMQEGQVAVVVSEQPILMGRSAIQVLTRLLNGEPLPEMTPAGAVPYPEFHVPLVEMTAKDLAGYDLSNYDRPPASWQVPSFQ